MPSPAPTPHRFWACCILPSLKYCRRRVQNWAYTLCPELSSGKSWFPCGHIFLDFICQIVVSKRSASSSDYSECPYAVSMQKVSKCVPTSGAVEYIASSLNSFWRHSSGGTQKALLCFQHALNWLLSFFSVQNLAQRILPVPITRQTLCDCRLSWLVIWGVTAQRENMVISNAVSWVGSELTVLSRILRLYAGAVGSNCLR